MGRMWAAAMCAVLAGSVSAARAQSEVAWMGSLDEDSRAALEMELAARGSILRLVDPPAGRVRLERAASAVSVVRGADGAALWLEIHGQTVWLCAVSAGGEELQVAQLPTGEAASGQTLAILAGDLLGDLQRPGSAPVRRAVPPAAEPSSPEASAETSAETSAEPSTRASSLAPPALSAASRSLPDDAPTLGSFVLDVGVAGSLLVGLELGAGVHLFGPLAVGVKARTFLAPLGPAFAGSLSVGVWWLEPTAEIGFDGGVEAGATLVTHDVDVGTMFARSDASLGWMAGGHLGVSFRTSDAGRLALRLGAAATPVMPQGSLIPIVLLSVSGTVRP